MIFRFLYLIAWLPLMAALGVHTYHRERVPRKRGFLMCMNHTSMLDVIPPYSFLWRKIHFMAKRELFKKRIGAWFFGAMGAFPVNRGGADVTAIRKTMDLLDKGRIVCMFPQGTRRPDVDPRETPVRGGAGMIAFHTKADVLPVCLRTKSHHVKWFRRTDVIIGDLIPYEELPFEKGGIGEYQAASEYIFDRICRLGEEEGEE